MAYTTIDKPTDYFNTKLWTGNATDDTAITGVGFSPDWVWIKNRSTTDSHHTADSVIGAGYRLRTDTSGAVGTQPDGVKSFDSDGITIGTTGSLNGSGNNIVGWFWRGSDSSAVSNTDGSITSTVSANTTAGFSIVKYTGTGSNATIGHGLGKKPDWIIVKAYEDAQQWAVQHSALGATKGIRINTTAAAYTSSTRWNNTEPTSSVFSVGSEHEVNTNTEDHIAYCFTSIKGYSKFGSYAGNSSTDGAFIYTGFKPALVIFKSTAGTESWSMVDNKRDTDNVVKNQLFPNLNIAEETTNNVMDFCSNGFKMRNNDSRYNLSGYTYIYMAFAENPFVTSTGIPTTAR